jgi:CheY-like chemotaxis protein
MSLPNSTAKAKIMVVEDESIIALDLQIGLEEAGYTVISVVSSGEEAINRCADLEPDLLLMDIHLKGSLDGIETARHIQRGQDIPILFLSASIDDLTLKRAQGIHAAGYIAKPFDAQSISRNIAAVLTNNQSEIPL